MIRTAIAFSLFSALGTAQEEEKKALWLTNFAEAKAQAKAEKKDLLVDFTGSDWCGWCIRLDNEVFSKEEFINSAPKSYVLVKLDYPKNTALLSEELQKQNAELQQSYKIQGFPTILLMDSEGRVYKHAGYQEGGPGPYNSMLAEAQKRGATFKAAMATADAKQGIERAIALDEALKALEEGVAPSYHFDLMKEIVALDADGKAGLRKQYADQVRQIDESNQANALAEELNKLIMPLIEANEPDKAIAELDKIIKEPKTQLREQMATFFKAMVNLRSKNDAETAVTLMKAAQKLNPNSVIGKQIAEILPQIEKQAGGGK